MDNVALDDDVEEFDVCVAFVGVDTTVTVAVAGAMDPAGLAIELDAPGTLSMTGQSALERDFCFLNLLYTHLKPSVLTTLRLPPTHNTQRICRGHWKLVRKPPSRDMRT